MRINNNIQALNAYRNLSITNFKSSKNMEKLSSGLRINRAADDAAGLAISEKMRSQIRGLKMAERNALDGVSLIQTAEGAINEIHAMLQRMNELAVQAANDTNSDDERSAIQDEIDQLIEAIDDIAERTEFNGKKLLNGTFVSGVLQTGASEGETLAVSISSITTSELGTSGTKINDINVFINSGAGAGPAITVIQAAIEQTSKIRSELGAIQNRLEHTIYNLQTTTENLTASESRIRDADMALEMTEFAKNNILNQAGIAMLAQANQLPQGVLQLLQ